MAHTRTAHRSFIAQAGKDRQATQRPSTPAVTKTEHLLGPKTAYTRCHSEQNRAATSEVVVNDPRTTTRPSSPRIDELKLETLEPNLLQQETGFENRARIIRNRDREEEGRCNARGHSSGIDDRSLNLRQDLCELATELRHHPTCAEAHELAAVVQKPHHANEENTQAQEPTRVMKNHKTLGPCELVGK
ncbi:LOW QUALITY PROTEIN: hypothetical protein YC2023_019843 [Brassica napus]